MKYSFPSPLSTQCVKLVDEPNTEMSMTCWRIVSKRPIFPTLFSDLASWWLNFDFVKNYLNRWLSVNIPKTGGPSSINIFSGFPPVHAAYKHWSHSSSLRHAYFSIRMQYLNDNELHRGKLKFNQRLSSRRLHVYQKLWPIRSHRHRGLGDDCLYRFKSLTICLYTLFHCTSFPRHFRQQSKNHAGLGKALRDNCNNSKNLPLFGTWSAMDCILKISTSFEFILIPFCAKSDASKYITFFVNFHFREKI